MSEFRVDPTIAYDVVEFPSKGILYKNKKKSARVAYLSATDEDILSSQTLLKTGNILEELLKRKILDKDISVEEMDEDDQRAILIFLRNTAWGSEYEITATDPKTNLPFKEKIDLGLIKVKDFKLVEDSNGFYPYTMNKSKANITFHFLTPEQEREIQKIKDSWNGTGVAPVKSKELEFMIKSVNGNKDPMSIYQFIQTLPISDSQDFRKYVKENKPGLDLNFEVNTPSGDTIQVEIGFGVEFFRPFYGL